MSQASASQPAAVRLFVGGHAGSIKGEPEDLTGDRCFSAAYRAYPSRFPDVSRLVGLLDSGAFTDPPTARLTAEQALARQLRFEERASEKWGRPWQARYLVSYDLLIDETWVAGKKHKRRWSVRDADRAVAVTIESAAYLARQRDALSPRTLVLAAQGVDPLQYAECAAEVLKLASPGDWLGLGGWCIIGKQTGWLPSFWTTLHLVLPQVAARGLSHVHLFGVLYKKALGGLLWLADHYGLTISTDSAAPILACTYPDPKKAGCLAPYWRDNVKLWTASLAELRASQWYRQPPRERPSRQLELEL